MGCGGSSASPDHRSELLALQDSVRRAHLDYDVDLLASLFADTLTTTDAGETRSVPRAVARKRFQTYFGGVAFLSWSDLEPPRVAVSVSGDLAVVHVRRDVRLAARDTAGRAGTESSVFAWTEVWRRPAEAWRLASVTSTRRPGPTDPGRPERKAPRKGYGTADDSAVDRILERAGTRVRVGRTPDGVHTLAFVADGAGPDGRFRTRLWSARDGRVRFVQETSAGDTIRRRLPERGSSADPGPTSAAGRQERAFLQGHDLLWMALDPRSLLGPPERAGRDVFSGTPANVVRFRDAAGQPVDLAYERGTGRLLGARLRTPAPSAETIVVYLSGWRVSEGLRLPRRAVFLQGARPYVYTLVEVRVNPDRPLFQP